jgi:hypothetical protein
VLDVNDVNCETSHITRNPILIFPFCTSTITFQAVHGEANMLAALRHPHIVNFYGVAFSMKLVL